MTYWYSYSCDIHLDPGLCILVHTLSNWHIGKGNASCHLGNVIACYLLPVTSLCETVTCHRKQKVVSMTSYWIEVNHEDMWAHWLQFSCELEQFEHWVAVELNSLLDLYRVLIDYVIRNSKSLSIGAHCADTWWVKGGGGGFTGG